MPEYSDIIIRSLILYFQGEKILTPGQSHLPKLRQEVAQEGQSQGQKNGNYYPKLTFRHLSKFIENFTYVILIITLK